MKHIKALFAWVLVLTFLCVGCKVQPLSMRTGGESAAIGAQPTFEDLVAEERTVTDGELFRAQFEGTAVEGSAGVVDGKYRITATKTDGEAWHVKLEANYPTVPGNDYRITYTFTSDVAGRVKFGDIQEFPIRTGENEVTGVVSAKGGTTYLDLQLGMLQPFTIDVEKITVAELSDAATYTDILPAPVAYGSEQAVYEQHDEGYVQSLERTDTGVVLNMTETPDHGDVWNSKLFVRTGAIPQPGRHYRISADVSAAQAAGFESCDNNGDAEKG